MSAHTPYSGPTTVSAHAELRWLQRGGISDRSVKEAWAEGFNVGVSTHRGKARLHPPTNTLLLERQGKLITVLHAGFTEFTADHLIRCTRCDLRFQPSADDRQCPWCEYPNERPHTIEKRSQSAECGEVQ
jgi:hypothetical protein